MSAPVGARDASLPADGAVEESHDVRRLPIRLPVDGGAVSGAVIIPAHNEAAVIARTLKSLGALSDAPQLEIIVVCNGCTDDTAEVARRMPGVTVLETTEASKTAALNHGDAFASRWPRLYLDADIDISPSAVLAVFDELRSPGVDAARPRYVYDTSSASRPVQAYYRARSRIPAPPLRLWGAGGYAVSESGHRRFSEFPQVTADDSWIDTQFADHEKRIVPTLPMRVRTPRDLSGLLAVLTRQRRGQVELGVPSTTTSRGRSLVASVRGPRSAGDMAWYVLLTAVARRRSRIALRARDRAWERDASSRPAEGVEA
ncbi:glycosyltransferase involved in cell wall biosynthesis [Okibacterium sp. HSC-33S16]|uniref:glycosyltransferase family 2 protein n=1 Tax=Okibacterium sp. HSC-33S16 TaxID=2910965 RepID=UPI00209F402F|nr:glycosyltransferase family 2 protein [Okibacterium sp. HSC-33S16]MCP2032787.1 glycosyltransferase involved in cell wall biosynthesis [Okibacterium sp. HSC-33S16]